MRKITTLKLYLDKEVLKQVEVFAFVLGHLSCITRNHRLGGINNKHLFLTIPEAVSPRSGLVRALLSVYRWCLLAVSSRGGETLMVLLGHQSQYEVSTLITSLEPQLQIPSLWGLELLHMIIGETQP